MMNLTNLLYGGYLAALFCFVMGMWQAAPLQDFLVQQGGMGRVRRWCAAIVTAVLVTSGSVLFLTVTIWRSDPFLRLSHMAWVLGLWLTATQALLLAFLAVRLTGKWLFSLFLSGLLCFPLVIYTTPLSHFQQIVSDKTLPLAFILAVTAVCLNGFYLFHLWQAAGPKTQDTP